MIAASLSDMKLVQELSHLSEFQMVDIENDNLMMKYFFEIGMDCYDFPFVYVAAKHRNLQGNIVTGFRCIGEVRCEEAFRNSKMAGITERLIISSYKDVSLMNEIAELSFKVRDFEEYLNDNDSLDWDADRAVLPDSQLEEHWQEEEKIIATMNDTLVSIRGPIYNSAGALKSAEEYKLWNDERKGNNDN